MTAPPRSEEWWPELGPKWRRTAATKPGFTVDIHAHVEIPESAEIAAPFFRPEHDPRLLYQPEESTRYNRELRATQQNDRIAQMVADRPDRFVGIANLPMDHPSSAVVELERAHHDLGFRGFEINADVNGGDLDDRRFDPVWEKAVELEMLAILHPHGFTHPQRMAEYYLANVVCMPLASTVAVSRMILSGVFERFPELKMLVVHGGGYLPFYFARTDHAYRVRPEARRHIPRPPSEYLHQLYFDSVVFNHGAVEYLVEEFGADRVLMGTDYPFDMGPTDPLGFLAGAALTDEQRALVVGGNAARLLKIVRPKT